MLVDELKIRHGRLLDNFRQLCEQCDLETRVDEKLRLKSILDNLKVEIKKIELEINEDDGENITRIGAGIVDLEKKIDQYTAKDVCTIVIKIEPYMLASKDRFILTIWKVEENKERQIEIPHPNNKDTPYYLKNEIIKVFPFIINDLVLGVKEVFIEVVLPLCLSNWNLNRELNIKLGTRKRNISKQYPLTLRSWERIYTSDFYTTHLSWIKKWPKNYELPKISNLKDKAVCCDMLFDDLERNHNVCILPAFFSDQDRQNEILGTVFSAGLPVVFWPFKEIDDAFSIGPELDKWDSDCSKWPKKILEQRQIQSTDFWNDWAVILDNPNKLPPDVRYSLNHED